VPSIAIALALCALAGGCSSTGHQIHHGRAITRQYPSAFGAKAIRPGVEVGFLYVYINNANKEPIVLRSVVVRGPGVGSVADPVSIQVAPLRDGFHHLVLSATPSTIYGTDPPVFYMQLPTPARCHKQPLYPVRGFRMSPGSQDRIYIVIRGVAPGTYSAKRTVVVYEQNGVTYRETVPAGIYGTVSSTARIITPDPDIVRCIKPTGSRYLPGQR
jgi:hypothetical protein